MRIPSLTGLGESLSEVGFSEPRRRPRNVGAWWLAGVCFDLAYWLGLPWRCKIRHTRPSLVETWNADACAVEEAYLECGRCQHYFGRAPHDPTERLIRERMETR